MQQITTRASAARKLDAFAEVDRVRVSADKIRSRVRGRRRVDRRHSKNARPETDLVCVEFDEALGDKLRPFECGLPGIECLTIFRNFGEVVSEAPVDIF